MVRSRRTDKHRFERQRIRLAMRGRVLPHWLVFALAVAALEAELDRRGFPPVSSEDGALADA